MLRQKARLLIPRSREGGRLLRFTSLDPCLILRKTASNGLKKYHRITKVGRVIRRMRIDEIPQLFNAKGDMSVIGPRPERPFFTIEFNRKSLVLSTD